MFFPPTYLAFAKVPHSDLVLVQNINHEKVPSHTNMVAGDKEDIGIN